MSSTIEIAKSMQADLVAMRRELHAHPELNFVEYKTSEFAAEKLTALGFTVRQIGGKTGLVADFGSGSTTIAIRCDMDGLPIAELNRTTYASQNPGVMHACGHDAHLACTLGAAAILSQSQLPGKIRIIIQPGDDCEGKVGASTMLEAGALEGVTALLGLHVDATIPTGKVGIVTGAIMPSVQRFVISISANGNNDSPDTAERADESLSDSALTVAKTVCELYKAPAQFKTAGSAAEQVSILVQSMHSGYDQAVEQEGIENQNCAKISGTLKTYSADMQKQVQEQIEKIAKSFDSNAKVDFEKCIEQTVSSAAVTNILNDAAVDLIGANNVLSIKRKSWNYQFTLLTERVPGAMIYLGAELSNSRRIHQTATFDIDENCLSIGTAILVEAALRLF
jgi:amidohydrolase